MQSSISTNIRLPKEVWKAIKIRAAEEGRSMKDLILEGIEKVLQPEQAKINEPKNPLTQFLGKVESSAPDGSVAHDRYLED